MATSKKLTGETLFDLTSFVADTHASPSQQQANATAQMTHDISGLGLEKPLANYDQSTQSWRTCEDTFLLDSMLYSGKWPASGMTLNGKLFPQPQLVRRIVEIVSSLWPTPTARDHKGAAGYKNPTRNLADLTYLAQIRDGFREHPTAPTPSGNWPTPTVSDIYADNLKSSQQSDGSMHSVSLAHAVQMWPTPTATVDTSNINGKFNSLTLWDAVRMWPTPTHGKLAGGSGAFQQIQDKYDNNEITLEEKKAMQAGNGGRLNPMWVEWLMGFPLGWTDLEDSETL
jgi:DNA (cytosine-5)-methyltransferase 1